jgi:zinc transport system substrate-binding protein
LSFHDAWQHFDTHYGLNFAGAVTLDVSRLPGAKHVQDIRHIIEDKQAVCLFKEPQFSPTLVKTLVEGSNIRIGELDPLGMSLPLDDNTYIALLQQAAASFQECLR